MYVNSMYVNGMCTTVADTSTVDGRSHVIARGLPR